MLQKHDHLQQQSEDGIDFTKILLEELLLLILAYLDNPSLYMLFMTSKCFYTLMSKKSKMSLVLERSPKKLMCQSIEFGYLSLVQSFRKQWHVTLSGEGYNYMKYIAKAGHLSLLQWARDENYKWYDNTSEHITKSGNLESLQWALDNKCPWSCHILYEAAMNGSLEILKWARKERSEWSGYRLCLAAAHGGKRHIIEWLLEIGIPLASVSTFENVDDRNVVSVLASGAGHLELLKWLRLQPQCPWNEHDLWASATVNEHLHIMQWFREIGMEWDANVCLFALMTRNETLFKWAVENGCPYDKNTLWVFSHGNLEEWLNEHERNL